MHSLQSAYWGQSGPSNSPKSPLPHAFVIGRDGKLRWNGHPGREEFERAIEEALKE